MKRKMIFYGGGCAAALIMLTAATPAILQQIKPGNWELARAGGKPVHSCVADLNHLAQLEHRAGRCTQVVIRDLPTQAEVHYTCIGGSFGRTTLKLITPRSVRIETQGIASGAPFNYVVQARRVGDCGQPPIH